MLLQRCRLEEHSLIVPVCVNRHSFLEGELGAQSAEFSQSEYLGLIDTGAQRTVVTSKVITEQADVSFFETLSSFSGKPVSSFGLGPLS